MMLQDYKAVELSWRGIGVGVWKNKVITIGTSDVVQVNAVLCVPVHVARHEHAEHELRQILHFC